MDFFQNGFNTLDFRIKHLHYFYSRNSIDNCFYKRNFSAAKSMKQMSKPKREPKVIKSSTNINHSHHVTTQVYTFLETPFMKI